jgi:DNA polymerase-4
MIGCALVPYFAAAVERRDDPSLAAMPLVIYELPGDHRPSAYPANFRGDIQGTSRKERSRARTAPPWGRVFAVSYQAAGVGIRPGMPLAQARVLCPQARFVLLDQIRYQRALDALLEVLTSFTPQVESGGFQPAAVVYLELPFLASRPECRQDGLATSPDGHPKWAEAVEVARRIGQTVREKVGLEPAIGLAGGKFPAYVAAASVESNKALLIVPGQEAVFLAPLPIDFLPLDEETARRLQLLGIHTLGQLANLPISAILTQFGMQGRLLHQLARGYDKRPVLSYRPELTESVSRQLNGPVVNRAVLEAIVQVMTAGLAMRLQARGLVSRQLKLLLHLEDGTTHEEQIVMRQPTGNPERLNRILGELMAQAEIGWGITELEVILADMIPAKGQQLDLFVHQAGQEGRMHEALKDLVARYGTSYFYRISLISREARLPERRFRLQKMEAP